VRGGDLRGGARAQLLVRGAAVHAGRRPHGAGGDRGQHHAPDPGARPAPRAGDGILLVRGAGDGAVRVARGGVGGGTLRGTDGDRERRGGVPGGGVGGGVAAGGKQTVGRSDRRTVGRRAKRGGG